MMWAFLSVLVGVAVLGALVWRYVQLLDSDRKLAIIDAINGVLMRAEVRGVFPAAPAFERNYLKDYPHLKILEDNYPVIREECEKLLGLKEKMTDMEMLGGSYTAGGIHRQEIHRRLRHGATEQRRVRGRRSELPDRHFPAGGVDEEQLRAVGHVVGGRVDSHGDVVAVGRLRELV